MSPQDETNLVSETSPTTSNEDEERTVVKAEKKPFLEPTISVSLNILDSTAFFGGSTVAETAGI